VQVPPALTAERQLLERDIAALYKKVAAGRNGQTQTQVNYLVLCCCNHVVLIRHALDYLWRMKWRLLELSYEGPINASRSK
jgi:hypothetical protein